MGQEQPSLAGCRAKYRRAERHTKELESLLREFADSDPYRIVGKFDVEQRALIISAEALQTPDIETWGILLGDIVHNLRCALDHLVWQLALLSGEKPARHLQFPIETTGAQYWSRGKKGEPSTRENRLRGVNDDLRTIIDQAQPYLAAPNAQAHPLAILAYLSNIDKHCFIHTAFSGVDTNPQAPQTLSFLANADAGIVTETKHRAFPIEGHAEVARLTFSCPGPDPKVEMKTALPLLVGFSDRGIPHREIGQLLIAVIHVVESYAPLFDT